MPYEKRLCVLKQLKKGFSADGSPLSGAVYAERLGHELILSPKIAGLSPLREGRYALAVWIGGKTYCLELKGNEQLRISDTPPLKDGFSALLCFVRSGDAEPIAHGFCGGAPSEHGILLSVFSKKEKLPEEREKAQKLEPKNSKAEPPVPSETEYGEVASEQAPFRGAADGKPEFGEIGKYDDEAIASSDYFGRVWATLEDAGADACDKDEEKAAKDGDRACEDETNQTVHPFRLARGGLTYYKEVAPKLAAAMKKYPKDDTLKSVFPCSEWVKTENALLGVIYAEGQPRYLCVAMKDEPPAKVREFCIAVPESPYTETERYFVVFQDADTGEYVRVENA